MCMLTDIGLSESTRFGVKLAMFCRVVTVRGIAMTSGFNFSFEPGRVPALLQALSQKMKKVPPPELPEASFVFFFQKWREIGAKQAFRDVV